MPETHQNLTQFMLMTPPSPGAIAIIQIMGPEASQIISQLIQREAPPHATLVEIKDIDEALVVRYRDDLFQIMPHGGMRVIQRISEELTKLGIVSGTDIPPQSLYPEAQTPLEAQLLKALSSTISPCAVEILLKQRERWQHFLKHTLPEYQSDTDALDQYLQILTLHSTNLDAILTPPCVVLTGPPNVGKSTLTNLVMGTQTSITADIPGTTRDWVSSLGLLPTPCGELAIRWFDTPGLHQTEDQIEASAIQLARSIIDHADCLILMHDPKTIHLKFEYDWKPDLIILNKVDLIQEDAQFPNVDLTLSAHSPDCLNDLGNQIVEQLHILNSYHQDLPWAFNSTLKNIIHDKNWNTLQQLLTSC